MGNKINKINSYRPKSRRSIPPILENFGNHLVFAEGSKTEPLYIENLKKVMAKNCKCSVGDITILVADKNGNKNTLNLVRYAEDNVTIKRKSGYRIDDVWIFFDKDDFPQQNFDNAIHAINDKNKECNKSKNDYDKPCDEYGTIWHACYSNECFELWPLLHFEYLNSGINRSEYIDKINKHIKDKHFGIYSKSNENIHDLLILNGGTLDAAIDNAKKLQKLYGTNNPSTGIFEFAERFKFYIEGLKLK